MENPTPIDEELISVKGEVEYIKFQNSENSFVIFGIIDDKKNKVICTGTIPDLITGEELTLKGTWFRHSTYGLQLKVSYWEKSIPTSLSSIERYLASGFVKGIGKKTSKKIVEMFGENTFDIIENDPIQLSKIRGISQSKAEQICLSFREQHMLRNVMMYLQDFDISPAYAVKIYKKYKDLTFSIMKENPYKLADDIWGIGFKSADRIAMSGGIQPTDKNRIKSAIKFVLNQNSNNSGHCYMLKEFLIKESFSLLELEVLDIDIFLQELQQEGQIFQEHYKGNMLVYLNFFYYAEKTISEKLLLLSNQKEEFDFNYLDKVVLNIENETSVKLATEQKIAVMESLSSGVLIITGGPGTGKTTTIKTIINLLKKEDLEILLTAPTGRAAKRMTEATGYDAKTMHRLLCATFSGEDYKKQTFEKNEDDPIEADVIIVDEASMIDVSLMHGFLKAVSMGTRLIFVGDVDQLPSVGAGNVLHDMICSNVIKLVRLEHVFRQAQESAIIRNAHNINNGQEPIYNENNSDFFFMERRQNTAVINTINELITTRLPKFIGGDEPVEIQILSPMRKGDLGVYNLNIVLQETLNPPSEDKVEITFRQNIFRRGDKVMQIKNNYGITWDLYGKDGNLIDDGTGVYNGDIGKIININKNAETLTVLFDDSKVVKYDFNSLEELELAYAITVHKSQGGEYPVVILPVYSGPPMLMTRNLLYTAITRAKLLVVLVGEKSVVGKMIHNNREIQRNTGLSRRLIDLSEFM